MNKNEFAKILLELISEYHHYVYLTSKNLFGHKKISLYDFMQWLESKIR